MQCKSRKIDKEEWLISVLTAQRLQNYRELDRGTNYFRAQMTTLREKYSDDGHLLWLGKVLWASLCYRLVNLIETFQSFGGIPEACDETIFIKSIKKQMNKGKAVFTGAHQNMGLLRYQKTIKYVAKSLEKLAKGVFEANSDHDLEQCYLVINDIDNVGPFFAWQVTCDLMECACLSNCTENDYAKLGNGAIKGIKILFGDNYTKEDQQLELAKVLHKIQDQVFDDLQVSFPRFEGRELTVKNIEHALCEFNKYDAVQGKLRKR